MEAEAKDVEAAQPAAAPPRDRKDSLSVRRQSVRKFSDAAPINRNAARDGIPKNPEDGRDVPHCKRPCVRTPTAIVLVSY